MLKVKICYVSLKCNASKLHEGHEWYDYVGYVDASLIKYSNKVHGNLNAKGRRMGMEKSPIDYIS
jgi:poly-D-alanine transfer protein DltD